MNEISVLYLFWVKNYSWRERSSAQRSNQRYNYVIKSKGFAKVWRKLRPREQSKLETILLKGSTQSMKEIAPDVVIKIKKKID